MSINLWSQNHPRDFWLLSPNPPDEVWQKAIQDSLPVLGLPPHAATVDSFLELTLGEGRFGPHRWRLSPLKRMYYNLKPLLPHSLTRLMRRGYYRAVQKSLHNPWPIDDRYIRFLWTVYAKVFAIMETPLEPQPFWPYGHQFAFVLTHDIEEHSGQKFVRAVADLEESLGFRSSFNFVPERYRVDHALMDELRARGFEIGVHGLKHDGHLFDSKDIFMRRAHKINSYLKEYGAVGFRSPLTLRNPEWMQALEVEYDLSFFDTDPFEPMPGGAMSIFPFFLGRFVELPYTLVQDHTLTSILHETTPRLWLKKADFIEKHGGLALLNSHPDYLRDPLTFEVYKQFLLAMHARGRYWHALPREVAAWWRYRSELQVCAENQNIPFHARNQV
jgi:hypothetical protein